MTNNKPTDEPMSLDTAITHADEQAASLSGPCAVQHMQLANWLRELQVRRKADNANPVAYIEQSNLEALVRGVGAVYVKNKPELARPVALYTAPPAPVVPDEITSTSAPEVFEIAAEAERLGLRGTYASYAVGWNACRAAMIRGNNG